MPVPFTFFTCNRELISLSIYIVPLSLPTVSPDLAASLCSACVSSFLSTAMDTFQEHHPKLASQSEPTEPTAEEVKEWNKDKLLKWLQQKRPLLFEDDDDLEKFKAAKISGRGFLSLAGDVDSFETKCHLPFGPSKELADLASEIAGGDTARIQGK
jgi:hypothetical protein